MESKKKRCIDQVQQVHENNRPKIVDNIEPKRWRRAHVGWYLAPSVLVETALRTEYTPGGSKENRSRSGCDRGGGLEH
jgi:hypothetical protein